MLTSKFHIVAAGVLAACLLTERTQAEEPASQLVAGDVNAVRLSPEAAAKLGIRTAEIKPRGVPRPQVLRLSGSLALDPLRLERARSRVAGVVVELGKTALGDRVKKHEVMTVVESKELAAKKGDLVDALVQFRLEREILDRAEKAAGAVPEVFLLQARRNVESASCAVQRADRTLRAWHISDEEIKALQEHAKGLAGRKGKRDPEAEKGWARLELRAARDGVVVEKNITLHEIVDPTTVLFVIADLSRLRVVVAAPEEDLPALQALKPEQRRWVIRFKADPDGRGEGSIDEISSLIDPAQHTAVVVGTVANSEGRMRAGQLITAAITLPTPLQELILPASALVEAGHDTFVFVQPDPAKTVYVQRRVEVVRRGHDTVHVRFTRKAGERVVTAGVVELKAVLDDLTASSK